MKQNRSATAFVAMAALSMPPLTCAQEGGEPPVGVTRQRDRPETIREVRIGITRWEELTEAEKSDADLVAAALLTGSQRKQFLTEMPPALWASPQIASALTEIFYELTRKELAVIPLEVFSSNPLIWQRENLFYPNVSFVLERIVEAEPDLATRKRLEDDLREVYSNGFRSMDTHSVSERLVCLEAMPIWTLSAQPVRQFWEETTQQGTVEDRARAILLGGRFGLSLTAVAENCRQLLDAIPLSERPIVARLVIELLVSDLEPQSFEDPILGRLVREAMAISEKAGFMPFLPPELYGATEALKLEDIRDDPNSPFLRTMYMLPEVRSILIERFADRTKRKELLDSMQRLDDLADLSPVLSVYPDVVLHVRLIANRYLQAGCTDELDSVTYSPFMAEWGLRVPELAWLITAGEAEFGERGGGWAGLSADLFFSNPRAVAAEILRFGVVNSAQLRSAFNGLKSLEILNIQGIERFDNAGEIIRQRTLLSDAETRERLSPLTPLSDLISLRTQDDRPFALVIAASSQSDHNDAFATLNNPAEHRKSDIIDRLTAAYRVVYFELGKQDEFARTMKQVASELPGKVELFIPIAHGFEGQIAWGSFSAFVRDERLESTDDKYVQDIGKFMKPGGTIAFVSCSTGGQEGGVRNIQQLFIDAAPDCYVIAPNRTTAAPEMELDQDGRFLSFTYVGADMRRYSPSTRMIETIPGKSVNDLRVENLSRAILAHPWSAYVLLGSFLGLGAVAGDSLVRRGRSGLRRLDKDRGYFPGWGPSRVRSFIAGFTDGGKHPR